jgi:hypothetical protein
MRRCAERNDWVATPKIKVTLKGQGLIVYILSLLHNFVTAEFFLNNLAQVITCVT